MSSTLHKLTPHPQHPIPRAACTSRCSPDRDAEQCHREPIPDKPYLTAGVHVCKALRMHVLGCLFSAACGCKHAFLASDRTQNTRALPTACTYINHQCAFFPWLRQAVICSNCLNVCLSVVATVLRPLRARLSASATYGVSVRVTRYVPGGRSTGIKWQGTPGPRVMP